MPALDQRAMEGQFMHPLPRIAFSFCLSSLICFSSLSIAFAKPDQVLREEAAAASYSPSYSCLAAATSPSVRVVACTIAIDGKMVGGADLAAAYVNRGQGHRSAGDSSRAAADFREAIRLLDGLGELSGAQRLHRGIAHHALGQSDRALADYNAAIELDARNALAYADRAILRVAQQDPHGALADLDRALNIVPDNPETLALRAEVLAATGENVRALTDLDRAIALAPSNPRLLTMRGVVMTRLDEPDQALENYRAALTFDERHIEARVNRGALYALLGDNDKAIADLDIALEIQPQNSVAAYNRGYAHFAKRDYERALVDYSAAIDANPRLGWAFTNRCLTRVILGRELPAALADCDQALKLMPGHADTRETRGFVHLKLGDNEIALKEYEDVLRENPGRPLSLWGRALARARKGDTQGSAADRDAARALLPKVEREFAAYGVR
ncbi:MAG: tetratricopeptide repeat protein [Reyranella sp.]|nr:MAG: tetratricopeptide repeat protein [Reyranella sp.]